MSDTKDIFDDIVFSPEERFVCSSCGKEFSPGNRADGLPNGVGFVLEDGSTVVVCADCVIEESLIHGEE